MDTFLSKYVQCPFYVEDGRKYIRCEGVEAGTNIRLGFRSDRKCVLYENKYCTTCDWEKCRIAKMLGAKYGQT